MDRKAAAAYLNISLRTLDRLTAAGRLRKGRALRKTRPVVVFEEAEVSALKADLERERRPPFVPSPQQTTSRDTVAFRLDAIYIDQLAKEGSVRGQSAGEYARHLVIKCLEDTREASFTREVRRLREGLADTVFALLTMKLGSTTEEAERFIRDTILREDVTPC